MKKFFKPFPTAEILPDEAVASSVAPHLEEREFDLVQTWHTRILEAEKIYKPYYDVVRQARRIYKSGHGDALFSRPDYELTGGYNIFWAGIETQKPFLYTVRPKACLTLLNKMATVPEKIACKILERALEWNLNRFDFDSVVKYARNDYLISGCGILWETYCPEFLSLEVLGEKGEVKTNETVKSCYVDPLNFLTGSANNAIWEEISWVARKLFMRPDELKKAFKSRAELLIQQTSSTQESFVVYEIWDKVSATVYWLSPDLKHNFLSIKKNPLRLSGFFPTPKPIFASQTNDSILPVPDYVQIKQLLDELGGVTERMRLILKAFKVSGVYDSAFSRLCDIFNRDVTLVAVPDFDKLKNAGGLKGVIDFIPIEQYVSALEILAKRRETLVAQIYEITGISDILRGSSLKIESATAVAKKSMFGTLRTQDRLNDMNRFIKDCYQMKAEIICAHFSTELLKSFISPDEGYCESDVLKAIHILRDKKLTGILLEVETSHVFDESAEAQKVMLAIENMNRLIKDGFQTVSEQPLLLPLYKQMMSVLASALSTSRAFEGVLDQVFAQIEKELAPKVPLLESSK